MPENILRRNLQAGDCCLMCQAGQLGAVDQQQVCIVIKDAAWAQRNTQCGDWKTVLLSGALSSRFVSSVASFFLSPKLQGASYAFVFYQDTAPDCSRGQMPLTFSVQEKPHSSGPLPRCLPSAPSPTTGTVLARRMRLHRALGEGCGHAHLSAISPRLVSAGVRVCLLPDREGYGAKQA